MVTAIVPQVHTYNCSREEWQARVDLACAYRAASAMGWNPTLIFNHISLRVPGADGEFLINPFGLMYEEMTASSLIKVDWDGNKLSESDHPVLKQGFVVHSAIHRTRPDVHCVIHTHTKDGIAVACQRNGLLPLSIESMVFTDRIGYHDVEGVTDDVGERDRIAGALGDKQYLILRNHGLLVCGSGIAEAFHDMMALELACRIQIAAMSGGAELNHPPKEVARKSAAQVNSQTREGVGSLYWAAVRRWIDRINPGYDS